MIIFGIADLRLQPVDLIAGIKHRLADLALVERLGQPVHPADRGGAEQIVVRDHDIGIAADRRNEVVRQRLDDIDLAPDEGIGRRLEVRHADPFVAVDLDHLAAGKAVGRLAARHIVRIALVDRAVARLELVAQEAERPRADELGERLGGRLRGVPFRHDEGEEAGGLGERRQELAIGRFQHDLEAAPIDRPEFGDIGQQPRAHRVALAPALQRGDGIGRGDRRAVVEGKAGPQVEGIDEAVARDLVALGHLRLDLKFGIGRQQRVVDIQPVIAGGPGR